MTLRENRLKRVAGGTIVESEACLIGNRAALRESAPKLEVARQVLELIEAQMRSREYFSLTGNIRGDSPEAVARRVTSHTEVAGLRGPTISKVYPKLGGEEGWYAATVVVQSRLLLQADRCAAPSGRDGCVGGAAPLRVPEQVLELRGAAPTALSAATTDDESAMIGPDRALSTTSTRRGGSC